MDKINFDKMFVGTFFPHSYIVFFWALSVPTGPDGPAQV